MLIKQLEKDSNNQKFAISYLDKNESMFLLSLLRPIPCPHCPDFYKGCKGGMTLQESAMLSDNDYIDKHIMGTEEFICGKLRNIIALSRAEEQEIHNNFENEFNKRISVLTRRNDDGKFVLIQDKDEFNNIIKSMERQMVQKIQNDVDKINQHNASLVQDMQERIATQEQTIQQMQSTIQKLKRKLSKNDVA